MKDRLIVVIAGVPPEADNFVSKLHLDKEGYRADIVWNPLHCASSYSNQYAEELYVKLIDRLKEDPLSKDKNRFLMSTNLIVLYVDKGDNTESTLCRQFEFESLVVPIRIEQFSVDQLSTGGQKRQFSNSLVRQIRISLANSTKLLDTIRVEIQEREYKTCLLLPPKNFGRSFKDVVKVIQSASMQFKSQDVFEKNLAKVKGRLPSHPDGYVGRPKRKFKAAERRNRHGTAPLLDDNDKHRFSCVLRGRLRFGSSYSPTFHYDCSIGRNRKFINCHDDVVNAKGRQHVNIAPNDNVR